MKLKIALIAAATLLTGCQMPQGSIYNASEVGKIRTQAEVDARTGEVQWRNGTGLTYTRTPNQCGKNCAAQAELAAKLDEERRNAQPREDYLRAVAKNNEIDRNTRIAEYCERFVNDTFKEEYNKLIDKRPSRSDYRKSYEYSTAFDLWKKSYTKLQSKALKTENECNRVKRNASN